MKRNTIDSETWTRPLSATEISASKRSISSCFAWAANGLLAIPSVMTAASACPKRRISLRIMIPPNLSRSRCPTQPSLSSVNFTWGTTFSASGISKNSRSVKLKLWARMFDGTEWIFVL